MNNFYLLLAFVTGAGVAAQSVINSRLRLLLGGPIWAAAAQFIVGLVSLLLVAVATRQPTPVTNGVASGPWWVWTGGAFGATFIVVTIVLTAKIGATLTLASIIVGQAERMANIVRQIGRITRYETKSYVGGAQILDLERAVHGDPEE